ncbi:MAG TPA: PDZ domain-containing protein [Rubrobacter sp.]|nr:PDZ domain-containing protein [Rubrobacter sp.]
MSASDSNLRSRLREWFGRLGRAQKVLAASATLVITVGGVASGITAVLDLGGRISAGSPASSDTPATSLPVAEGVRVTEVIPDSPADRAGLEVGDIITDVGGESVEDVDDLRKVLSTFGDSEAVRMSVVTDSGKRSVLVKPEPIEGTRQRMGIGAQDLFPKDGAFRKSSRLDEESRARSAQDAGETPAGARGLEGESATDSSDAPSARQYPAED